MWLLDVNIDLSIIPELVSLGYKAESSIHLGWRELRNGNLLQKAIENNYEVLLTRDKLFYESAAKAFKKNPNFAIVLMNLPQAKSSVYLEKFREAWKHKPIQPIAGTVIHWPSES